MDLNSFIIGKNDTIKPIINVDGGGDLDNTRTIAFGTDETYVKYFAVALQSLIQNSENNRIYDIVVFENKVSSNSKALLLSMLPDNFSLRFFNINSYIESFLDISSLATTSYWSIATWYKCFIPLLMSDYKKVLYADVDVTFNNSIEDLFNIDFENNEILAVRDISIYWRLEDCKLEKDLKMKIHFEQALELYDNTDSYFNAGIIMFNTNNIDTKEYKNSLEKYASLPELLYLDQDVLNAIFNKKKKLIPYIYNLQFYIITSSTCKSKIKSASKDLQYALENPIITHYTGAKPWRTSWNDSIFIKWWRYAKNTPFYENILHENFMRNKPRYTFLERIFSVKNDRNKTHKIIRLLGIKIKIRVKPDLI